MARKLASIQKVLSINPIDGADLIEVAQVMGWRCVIKKSENIKVGDLVVYCEIDSVFPEKEEYEFLRSCNFRIRTRKFKSQISQGICFPLSILPSGNYNEGDDITQLLEIQKYESVIPECLEGIMKGDFPSFIRKTDETRVQVLQDILTKYKGTKCYYTCKIDGESGSFFYNNNLDLDDQFGVCSRTLWLMDEIPEIGDDNFVPKNTFLKIAQMYDLKYRLKLLDRNLCIQGEVIGEGIKKNKYKINGHDLRVFNIFDIDNYKYLDYEEFIKLNRELGLKVCPVLNDNFTLIDDIDALVELSKGKSILNPKIEREGIVIRPLVEIDDPKIGRVSFKSINSQFLLNFNDE